jgi:endonuclease YncB( thermonuclease family)
MTRIVPIALLCIALAGAALAQGKKMMEVSGPARVLDADVLVVAEKHPPVRLYGIDAPEPLQPCFIEGKAWACNAVAVRTLQLLIEHYDVTCRQVEDTNRRRRG